jgi:hypothetical protein
MTPNVKPSKASRSRIDARKSDQANRFKGARDHQPPRPADRRVQRCRRMEREIKSLRTGADMTLTGDVLVDALATVNDASG